MQEEKIYFVIDMNTFFASVECAERGLNPFDTLLVVADEASGKSPICLAISPKMKKLGVKNRCRLGDIPARLKYIIAKPRMKKYIEYATEIYGIYLDYIDSSDIHVYSIDECFLDVTDYLKLYNLSARELAKKFIDQIWEKLKIPASVGIGTNLFLAKIALDLVAKNAPDRVFFLDENLFKQRFSRHRPITDFWQISDGIKNRLERLGILTLYDITQADEKVLYDEFGVNAELLIDHAHGQESCTMADIKAYKTKNKSLNHSQILSKGYNVKDALVITREMAQALCYEMQKNSLVTNQIFLELTYEKRSVKNSKARKNLEATTNLSSIIDKAFIMLFNEIARRDELIRKISVSFFNIQDEKFEQYDMFADMKKIKKEKSLSKSILSVQEKFGKNSILKGRDFFENATQRERNQKIGGHSE